MEYQIGEHTLHYCIDGETCLEEYYEVYDFNGNFIGEIPYVEDIDETFITLNLIQHD